MSHVILMGHLGDDAKVSFTPSNKKVVSFRMAVNQKRGGQETTMWWQITCWGEDWQPLVPYLRKGSGVIVAGEMMKPEIYHDRESHPQMSLKLVASRISFNPFGRGERSLGEGGKEMEGGRDFAVSNTHTPVCGQEKGLGGELEGSIDHEFAEDEIPF